MSASASGGNGLACSHCDVPPRVHRLERQSLLHSRDITNVAADLRDVARDLRAAVADLGEYVAQLSASVAPEPKRKRRAKSC
jgi:hypothetical protein